MTSQNRRRESDGYGLTSVGRTGGLRPVLKEHFVKEHVLTNPHNTVNEQGRGHETECANQM